MKHMRYRIGTLATIVFIVLGFIVILWYVPQALRLYIGAGLLLFAFGCYGAGYLRGYVDAGYKFSELLNAKSK